MPRSGRGTSPGIADVPLDGLWVLSLSNGEIDDRLR